MHDVVASGRVIDAKGDGHGGLRSWRGGDGKWPSLNLILAVRHPVRHRWHCLPALSDRPEEQEDRAGVRGDLVVAGRNAGEVSDPVSVDVSDAE